MNADSLDRLKKIQGQLEAAKTARSKAEGALENLYSQLRADFGVVTLEAAQEKLKSLQTALAGETELFDELMAQLEAVTKWDDL
jgi:hypothetical protein